MIKLDGRYMLRQDKDLSPTNRCRVEILHLEMGGTHPVLFRYKEPAEDRWSTFRATSDGRYSRDNEEHIYDLIELPKEKWRFVYVHPLLQKLTLWQEDFPTEAAALEACAKLSLGPVRTFLSPENPDD